MRGGIPTPDAATCKFGGNTPCLEVRCGEQLLIFDAGTGIRQFGAVLDQSQPIDADIFLTHCRFERTCGLPFFVPGYNPSNSFSVWGATSSKTQGVEAELTNLMTSPLFPIPLSFIGGLKKWCDFRAGDTLTPRKGIKVRTVALNHPQNATGFRLEYGGRSLCYISNTGHVPGKPDKGVLKLIKNADTVIYDSHYFDDAYPAKGLPSHSTWQEGARLCKQAGAKQLVPFLHHPDHNDARLDEVQRALDANGGGVVAYEGLELAV